MNQEGVRVYLFIPLITYTRTREREGGCSYWWSVSGAAIKRPEDDRQSATGRCSRTEEAGASSSIHMHAGKRESDRERSCGVGWRPDGQNGTTVTIEQPVLAEPMELEKPGGYQDQPGKKWRGR